MTPGKQRRIQQGLYNGTLSFGYKLNEKGIPVLHPTDATGVILAFQLYATGEHTDAQIANLLNQEGYRTTGHWGQRLFTKDTVNRLLQNTFYLGVTKYKGETFPGQHPALIDQELFDRCQQVREQRAHFPTMAPEKRVYVFAGIVRCSECELTLRGSSTQSKGGWQYYRHTAHERGYDCSIPNKMIRVNVLEEQWAAIIAPIRLSEDWQERIQAVVPSISCPRDLEAAWAMAALDERRAITQMLLQGLYVDVLNEQIVALRPQPDARELFDECQNNSGVVVF